MNALSASRVGLFLRCTWWAQDAVELSDVGPKKPAQYGLAVHDVNEAQRNRKPVDLSVIAERRGLSPDQRDSLERVAQSLATSGIPFGALAEVTFAWDWRTGKARELGRSLGRKYVEAGLTADEVPGTCDLVWVDGDCVVLEDVKSGFFGDIADHEEQLMFLAMSAALAYRATSARIVVRHAVEDTVTAKPRDVEDFELAAFADALAERIGSHLEADVHVASPGAHCKEMWCGAIGSCPAATGAVEALIPAAALVPSMRMTGPITSNADAANRVRALPLLTAAVKAWTQQLKEWADANTGVDLGDGSTWGAVTSETKSLDASPLAIDVLERVLGKAVADDALELGVSAASIERAVKKHNISPIKKTVDGVVAELKTAGAVKVSRRTEYGILKERKAS